MTLLSSGASGDAGIFRRFSAGRSVQVWSKPERVYRVRRDVAAMRELEQNFGSAVVRPAAKIQKTGTQK